VLTAQGLKGTNILVLTRSPTGENHTLRSLHRPEGIKIGCPILTQTEGESDAQAKADEGADRSISRHFTRRTFQLVTVRLFETFLERFARQLWCFYRKQKYTAVTSLKRSPA
jgi:hypothetical protein